MAKYIFNAGVSIGGPQYAASTATMITVIDRATDTLASLWSDRDGVSILGNPFPIQSSGQFFFYADDGRYQVTATNGTYTRTWEDIILGAAGGGGGGSVESVTGTGDIDVDNTDPTNPVVSYTGSSSGYTNVTESTTARTLDLDDHQTFIDCTNAAGCAITVPPQSSVSWVDNTQIIGVGELGNITFVEGASVEILIPDGRLLECYKGAPWALRRLTTNKWALAAYLVEA